MVNRSPLVIASGQIRQSATGDVIVCPGLADASLTSSRVPYASTGGLLVDSAYLTTDSYNVSCGGVYIQPTTARYTGAIYQGSIEVFHTYSDANANGNNIFIGPNSGNFTMGPSGGAASLSSLNVGVGYRTLHGLTTGYNNLAFGTQSSYHVTTGYMNMAFGNQSLYTCTTGNQNVCIGEETLYELTTGQINVAIGRATGFLMTSGVGNVLIGYGAGTSVTSGDYNICIGTNAGYYETGNLKLFIDCLSRASEADGRVSALIYGVMDASVANQTLSVNAALLLGTSQTTTNGLSGTVIWSMPFMGTAYKKFVAYLTNFTSAGTVLTFPTAFSKTPHVYGDTAVMSIAVITTTTITLTSIGAVAGNIFVEGF